MKTLLLSTAFALAASLTAWGDAIPYPNIGVVAPTVPLVAASSGSINGYFYGASAGDTDQIQMCDLTASFCSPFEFNNQTSAIGSSADFGSVTAGDVLVFNLMNDTAGYVLSSDPGMSVDGTNHAYVTSYSGTGGPAGIPAGTFVGMEDLALPGSDLDYNDDQFVFTNVATSMVPEPSAFLPCLALLAMLPVARRKFGLRPSAQQQ